MKYAKISVEDYIFHYFQFKDITVQSSSTLTIVGASVAVLLVIVAFLICLFCGLFKRISPEERARRDGLTEHGFVTKAFDGDTFETTKMLQS